MPLSTATERLATRTEKALRQRVAACWAYVYNARAWFLQRWFRYRNIAWSAVLLLSLTASAYLSPALQPFLDAWLSDPAAVDGLRNLVLNTGIALIGAVAIVTSLVLFAMQVNIERMPHGLFRRLSADRRLLGAFALAFSLALALATLSTVVDQATLAYVVVSTLWGVLLIVLLFLYAYRRALVLVNPAQQLRILLNDTEREFAVWARHAERTMPLYGDDDDDDDADRAGVPSPADGRTHDVSRTVYFELYTHWTHGAERALAHAMSFARRYAEQGDYEVSAVALQTVADINEAYINVKGKTFYARSFLLDLPQSTDAFINATLEALRRDLRAAVARRDERQIEQLLRAIAGLVALYLRIDYSDPRASPSHASLAARYLSDGVQQLLPHDMVDVVLEGQRLMGQCALGFIRVGHPTEMLSVSEKIALVACVGCAKEGSRSVTMEAMNQFVQISFTLLLSKKRDLAFAFRRLRRDVDSVSNRLLAVPDQPLSSVHSTFLAPYYSMTSMQGLYVRLGQLVESLGPQPSDDAPTQSVIANIDQWAAGLHDSVRTLLLCTLAAKSHFTFHLTPWIVAVTDILLAASGLPACSAHSREQLRSHAGRLIGTLDSVPGDEDTVSFVEGCRLTDLLLEAAVKARYRGCDDAAAQISLLLLSWTFKGGRYFTGMGVLERGLCACAVLALEHGGVDGLMAAVGFRVHPDRAPAREVLDDAARELRHRAARLPEAGHWSSAIDHSVGDTDHAVLAPLLREIADILSPP